MTSDQTSRGQSPEPTVAQRIVDQLVAADVSVVASLPDSWLTPTIDEAAHRAEVHHVRVAREEEGVGICAGAALGGRRGALICQNGGILASVNAIAGFAHHHQLPFLILAADRGGRGDRFSYQAYKGQVTEPVLEAVGVPMHRIDDVEHLHWIPEVVVQARVHARPAVVLLGRSLLLRDQEATA